MKQAILLLGAPGSGKGTQGTILNERIAFKMYTMSSMIKEQIPKGSEIYKKTIEQGILLNDLQIFEIFRGAFKGEDNVIIDGIPRTLDQAYWLYGYLAQHNYDMKLLFLNVDEDRLLDRVLKRGRADDNPEVFRDRLQTFDRVKQAILAVYQQKMIEVNGDQEVELVAREIQEKLGM